MKKKIAALLCASMLLSAASGCAKAKKPAYNEQTAIFNLDNVKSGKLSEEEEKKLREAYSTFIFGVMKKCAEHANGRNIMISVDSLLFALDMAAAGANGETLDQMLDVMIPGADRESAFQFAVARMNALKSNSLLIANSAWLNDRFAHTVKDDFLKYVKDNFEAEAKALPFDRGAVSAINSWVNEKTHGMIPTLIEDLTENDFMVLVNAITFESEWAVQYSDSDIQEDEFTCGDGTTIEVPFLHSRESTFLSDGKATGFIRPYEGGKYGFMAILPVDESKDINEFLAEMTPEQYWAFWNSQSTDTEVNAVFPEFKSEYCAHMATYLQEMGMTNPFSANADFTYMTDEGVSISDVIQKTFIEVNRKGTKAAAATAVHMTLGFSPSQIDLCQYVVCDRPFAYAIVDLDTGLPIFLGTVTTI